MPVVQSYVAKTPSLMNSISKPAIPMCVVRGHAAGKSLPGCIAQWGGLLLVLVVQAVLAQTTASYNLGAIPDMTVRNDSEIVFVVTGDASGGPPFTMTTSAGPAGAVTLDADTGLFRYAPAPNDKTVFAVTIAANTGVAHTFTITPQPVLPSEYVVFGSGERLQLTNSVAGDLIKLDRPSYAPTEFNYGSRTTHSVSIVSGDTLVIEQDNPNTIFNTFCNGRADIKEMELMAATLIIRSPMVLKQTKVSIYARELRFEGNGKIVTTPEEKPLPATDATGPTQPGANGVNGLPAGSVDVFVQAYSDATGNSDPKFVLTGGKGQAAGKGKHGVDGTSLAWWWNGQFHASLDCVFWTDHAYYTPPEGWYVTRWRGFNGSIVNGVTEWPGDGTSAWAPGTPGQGGNGGSLQTSHPNVRGVYGGGQAGTPGYPSPTSGHSRTDICEGGRAGFPQQSIHIHAYESGVCSAHIGEEERHTSVAGTTYNTIPTAAVGTSGARGVAGTQYSWLNPVLLRKIINDAKDDYLQNRIAATENRLKDYVGVLAEFRADATSWSAAPEMWRFELSQMYDDMQILLQQIANGLDYFGNPNGWVPMLSFEVNANLFDQEIDRSLDIVYLSRWITRKQDNAAETYNALGTARTKLAAEIDAAKVSYDEAVANLAGLKGEAEAIGQRVRSVQIQLETKDNELRAQAIENTRPPAWETGLRLALKTAAVVCEMVPVYQPALGAVGGALRLGSDFDPDDPWATITGAMDLSTTYLNSQIEEETEAQQDEKNKVNTGELGSKSKRGECLNNLSRASAALSTGIQDITSFIEKSKAPSSDMEAELDRLRSADPQYQTLVTDIQQLMWDKRQFADKIVMAIHNVASLSDLITRDILAIDGLSVEIGASASLIDARVNAYLKDMERRAFDRLLKYHYYMAKAYEYRMVRPYTAPLNLETLYNRMDEIASSGTPEGVLDSSQKDVLKSLFKQVIADTTQSIITDYNAHPSNPGSSFTLKLTAEEIAALNRGEVVNLNLVNEGLFLPTEENVRIADLRVYSPGGMKTTGSYSSPAYVDLLVEHSGISNLKLDGQVYQFRHYNQSTRNAITWKSRYEPGVDIISPTPLVAADNSLLRSLLPGLNTTDILLYSRPSAWANLRIWRAGRNGPTTFGLGQSNAPIAITEVTLQVFFDLVTRSDIPRKVRDVDVMVVREDDPLGASLIEDSLAPYFILSNPDINGRQDARGRFLRMYAFNTPAAVQLTAQDVYGSLGFYKWTENGIDIGFAPTITVTTTDDHMIFAHYVSILPVRIAVNTTGASTTLSWQGGEAVRLQSRSCLGSNCAWQDVPGTDGASSYTLPPAGAAESYYRLVRVR